MNQGSYRHTATLRSIKIWLLIALLAGTVAGVGTGRAGLSNVPYRLEPAMTSSTGSQLSSLNSSESLIVWEAHHYGRPDIFAYDLNELREFRVSRGNEPRREPAVHGSEIIWVSGEPGQQIIRGIDRTEGLEFDVTDTVAELAHPAISDQLFAWQERSGDRWIVRVLQRDTGETMTLGEDGANAGKPVIAGSVVAWQQHDGESWNIHIWDQSTGSAQPLTNSAHDEKHPAIAEQGIVFIRTDVDGGPPQLIASDHSGSREQVLDDDHFIASPAIHGQIVVWEDWGSGLPEIYAWDLEHEEEFAVARSQQATAPTVSERVIAWVSGNDTSSQRVQALEIQERLPTDPQDPPAVPSAERLYVSQTEHYVSTGFKAFWQANGGPSVLGYPLTEEFSETDSETSEQIIVQYFERVKMEYHPNAPEDERVRLARLGETLRPEREAVRVEPFESTGDRRYFEATGQVISHGFKEYWEDNGGLSLFGYPLTGEFVENGRTVQYFERARFEFDPEAPEDSRVTLGLLGREALQERGWLPPPPLDTTQIFE